jgi:glutamate-1-semialdehyde 2,1-aminomutase
LVDNDFLWCEPFISKKGSSAATVPTLEQFYMRVANHEKLDALERVLESEDFEAVLVFARTQRSTAELAERLQSRVASVELLRFTNSGTEAVMLAVRTARATTGRDVIVKADGGYHGSWEQVPMARRAGIGGQGGTPQAVEALVAWCEYNDVSSLEAAMAAHEGRVAAVILEPVMGSGGVIEAEPAFLQRARELCDRHGALLIFDEVITLRLAHGGQQSVVGVAPDLSCFGKIIGGGLPMGATGGRADLMRIFDPTRAGFTGHSGTFNGNPLAALAGSVTLDLLDAPAIERINRLGARLAQGLRRALDEHGVVAALNQVGSLVQLHLGRAAPVRTFADAGMQHPLLPALHRAALAEGLLFAGRGLFVISTPMDDGTVDAAVSAFERALRGLPR